MAAATNKKFGYAYMQDAGYKKVNVQTLASLSESVRRNVVPKLKDMQKKKEAGAQKARIARVD